jgi:hypothetical protein
MNLRHTLAVAIGIVVAVAGCGPAPAIPPVSGASLAPPTATPRTPAPTASPAWLAADVPQPSAVSSVPSLEPGYFCDPCHTLAEDQLFGVGESRAGLIAVGVEQPPAQAIAFASTDGVRWIQLPGLPGAAGTTAIAVSTDSRRTVIVGLDPSGATAWSSAAGSWTQAPRQPSLEVPYAAGAMTSVVPFDGGFIAGGYRDDPLHAAAAAAVWRSNDGLEWQAEDGSGTFPGGRVWGVAATAGMVVAVGTNGDPNYGPAAAWRWTKADGWQRARVAPDASGAMRAVTATGSGFVAVGLNGHDDGALAWTSRDGLDWTAVPDQPALHRFGQPLRMQSVVAAPSELVAGGWRSDAGKGSAVVWVSADGVTWQGPTWEPSFSGGQITGLAAYGGAIVAVGRTGYPDLNRAAAWVSSARMGQLGPSNGPTATP